MKMQWRVREGATPRPTVLLAAAWTSSWEGAELFTRKTAWPGTACVRTADRDTRAE
jgi:hypothetical protein